MTLRKPSNKGPFERPAQRLPLRYRYLGFVTGGLLASALLATVALSSYKLFYAPAFHQSLGFSFVLTGAVFDAILWAKQV
jgi:hypothetical protein